MRTISERLAAVRFLWSVGAVVLCCLTMFLAIFGVGAYALVSGAAWLFGFDPLPWLFISALLWAPIATGYSLSAMSGQIMLVCWNAGLPPEETNDDFGSGSGIPGLRLRKKRKTFTGTLAWGMVIGGILAANLAPIVLAIEFMEWLTSREWPGLTVADGLALFGIIRELPESDSQRLIDLVLAIPLSISLFVVGLLACMAGLNMGDRAVMRDLEAPSR